MNSNDNNPSSSRSMLWIRAALVTFALGVVSGGVLIPIVHTAFYKETDPFAYGWPLYLQVSASLSSLIIAISLRCTATVALGVYVGLLGWMLASGQPEYPVSSAIGLLIHGFIPGALGSAIAFVVLWTRARILRPPAANKPVNPSGGSGEF
jgi:hypothetical protein